MQQEQLSHEAASLKTRLRDDMLSTRKGLHRLKRGVGRFGSRHRGAAALLALGIGGAVTYRATRKARPEPRFSFARLRPEGFEAAPMIGLVSAGALVGFATRLFYSFSHAPRTA